MRFSVNSCCHAGPAKHYFDVVDFNLFRFGFVDANFPRALIVTVSPSSDARSSTG